MGRKVHPIGFRIGTVQDWQAKWYADAHYAESLQEDLKLRQAIQAKYADASISLVEIDRQAKEVTVTIYTARPGIVIGRGGQRVDELSAYLENLLGKKVRLNIQEIRQPELDATLVARAIAEQIQRRIAYRRAMKQAIFRTMQAGAKGIRVSCSGRLGDAEIARRQTMHDGQVPLHTLRADIDYGFIEARTTLGRIGVKVWIFKGEVLPEPKEPAIEAAPAETAVSAEAPSVPEPEAAMAEPAAQTTEEAPAEAETKAVTEQKPEEAPARPYRRRKATAAKEEKPTETPPAEAVEATTEEKPAAKRRARAAKPKAETAPAATETTEASGEEKTEEKPAKPAAKRTQKKKATSETAAEAESADVTKDEDKDATAETG